MNDINDIGIVDFFRYLNEFTNMFVTAIEVKPIRIKEDIYITGLRRSNLTRIEAHVKHIKQTYVKTNDYEMEIPLKETAEEEMWIDVTLMANNVVRTAFNELRNYFFTLKSFEIANLQYKLKSAPNELCSKEETIIYDNKRIACKETIAKRKLCTTFKSKFIHWGDNTTNNKNTHPSYTDEELAELP